MIKLTATKRDVKIPASKTREEGQIPCVVYGPKFANTSVSLVYQDFIRLYNKYGETALISMEIDGKPVNVMIKDVDLHPVTNKVSHIDFYAPEAGKKVHANVPIEFVGESLAVKNGANLVKVLHEIEVEALPENLPHHIEADLAIMTSLDISIHISDLKLPVGVTTKMDADEVVASVVVPEEESTEPAAPIDLSKIEVEKKGKKEEEGAEAA